MGVRQHDVEGREAIGGDQEQIAIHLVKIANFPAPKRKSPGNSRLPKYRVHLRRSHRRFLSSQKVGILAHVQARSQMGK